MLGLSLTKVFLHGARQNLPAYSPDSVVRAGGVQAGAERAGAGMADLPTLGTVGRPTSAGERRSRVGSHPGPQSQSITPSLQFQLTICQK